MLEKQALSAAIQADIVSRANTVADYSMQAYFLSGVAADALYFIPGLSNNPAFMLFLNAYNIFWNSGVDANGALISAYDRYRGAYKSKRSRRRKSLLAANDLGSAAQLNALTSLTSLAQISPYLHQIPGQIGHIVGYVAVGGTTATVFGAMGGVGFAVAMWISALNSAIELEHAYRKTDLMYMFDDRVKKIIGLKQKEEELSSLQKNLDLEIYQGSQKDKTKKNKIYLRKGQFSWKLFYINAQNQYITIPINDVSRLTEKLNSVESWHEVAGHKEEIQGLLATYLADEIPKLQETRDRLTKEMYAIGRVKIGRKEEGVTGDNLKNIVQKNCQKMGVTEGNMDNIFKDFYTKIRQAPSKHESTLVEELEKNRQAKVYEKMLSLTFWTLAGIGMTLIAAAPLCPALLLPGIIISGVAGAIRLGVPLGIKIYNYKAKKQLAKKILKETIDNYENKNKLGNSELMLQGFDETEKLKYRLAYEDYLERNPGIQPSQTLETQYYKELLKTSDHDREKILSAVTAKRIDDTLMKEIFGNQWREITITDKHKEKIIDRYARKHFAFFGGSKAEESNLSVNDGYTSGDESENNNRYKNKA